MRLTFCLLVISLNFCYAQKITIQGMLTDSTGSTLPSATVMLLNVSDSSLLNFTASGQDGKFVFENIGNRAYFLKVSYVGYSTHLSQVGPLSAGNTLDVGNIRLREAAKQLNEVVVKGEIAPVAIKRDTIEFNAPSFKTNENAMVEDLLKKLPGVEVDNDGTIRAQGRQVQRVTVDGKPFFGNDPRLATRNLPANAIAKVQVFDKRSDQSLFTGIDDGEREKTINLELKEEKRKGAFGNISAGIGDDSRFNAKASINKFQKEKQLSFLGLANNVNESGFGIDEYMNFTGGSQRMMSGRGAVRVELSDENQNGIPLDMGNRPTGIMTTYAGGANFNRNLSRKTEVNASYFYNYLDHFLQEKTEREDYFNLGNFQYHQKGSQQNVNQNHRVNFTIDHRIDSANSIRFTTTGSYNSTEGVRSSSSNYEDASTSLINSSQSENISNGTSTRLNSTLLWRHRFQKKGRTFSLNLQHNIVNAKRNDALNALMWNKDQGDSTLTQKSAQVTDNNVYNATATYTEPIGKRKYLEFFYSFRGNKNSFARNVFDIKLNESLFNQAISADYTSTFTYHRGGMNLRINRRNFNFTAGASLQSSSLNGFFKTNDTRIQKSFENVLPVARLNYSFGGSKNLEVNYETNVEEPTIQQLQPVLDNSDPLNLYVGNPNLRPSYRQTLRLNYNSFDPVSFINFFTFLDVNYTSNAITTSQSINEDGIRLTKPVNVDDYRTVRLHASFGFPITRIKSRIGLSSNLSHQSGSSVINERLQNTTQNSIGGRVRYDLQYNDALNIGLAANITRQNAKFEIESQPDQAFFNNSYTADADWTILKVYHLGAALEVLDYRNESAGYDQAIPLLNISVSRYVLKGKSGEIRMSVNNILDKNLSVSQISGVNYLERREYNSMGRYFMLTFIYSLNKQLNPMGMRPRGGGMIRVIR